MHSYYAYGLHFSSQVELPELLSVHEATHSDVTIQFGEIPASLPTPLFANTFYEASPQQFLLKNESIARYLVQAGNTITIQPMPTAIASDIRVFLLGSCLGALLHQRDMLALHASAIETEYGAVLFAGPSGAGKSTLLNAFLQQGYKMFADDISAIYLNAEQQPCIMPGFPRTKLWADAAQQLQIETANLTRTRPQQEKYDIYVAQQFSSTPRKIHRIYCITTNNQDELSIHVLAKMKIAQILLRNTYRYKYLDGLAKRGSHFHLLIKVAQSVPVVRVTRPSFPYRLGALVDMLMEDIQSEAG